MKTHHWPHPPRFNQDVIHHFLSGRVGDKYWWKSSSSSSSSSFSTWKSLRWGRRGIDDPKSIGGNSPECSHLFADTFGRVWGKEEDGKFSLKMDWLIHNCANVRILSPIIFFFLGVRWEDDSPTPSQYIFLNLTHPWPTLATPLVWHRR